MGQNESKNSKNYQQEMAINTQIHFMQQQQAQMSINPNVNSKKPIQFIKQGATEANGKKPNWDFMPNKFEINSITDLKKQNPTKMSMFKELLECPICMNTYDNPHVLPCQHTFCKSCIASLKENAANNSKTISCPICRESHHLANGVESLTANYTMKRLIELEQMTVEAEKTTHEKKAKCFVCQRYDVLNICHECSYVLCHDCINNQDHHILIESKLNLKKSNQLRMKFTDDDYRSYYKQNEKINDQYNTHLGSQREEKVKILLICYSSEIDKNSLIIKKPIIKEICEDDYDKCSAYLKANVYSSDRVCDLKKMVEKKFGLSTRNQVMVYQDNIIKDSSKLVFSYHMEHMDKIHVFDERDFDENIHELEHAIYGNFIENSVVADAKAIKRSKDRSSKKYKKEQVSLYEDYETRDLKPVYKQPNQLYSTHNNFYNYNHHNYNAHNNNNVMMYQPHSQKPYAFHSNYSYY